MISDRLISNLRQTFDQSLLPKIGLALLILLLLMSLFAPLIATHDPTRTGHFDEESGAPYPPAPFEYSTQVSQDGQITDVTISYTTEHMLGTNNIGQDVYSRFVYGSRVSILVALLGVSLAFLIGAPVGFIAGYYGGRIDDGLMRIADVMLSFPALVLALALIGAFRESTVHIPDPIVLAGLAPNMPETIPIPGTVTIVAALVTWVWFARVARGEVLSVRNEEYIKAARSYGASDARILFRHVLPNSLTPLIVLATIQVAVIILLEASLAYLGFSGTTLSWGFEIERGQDLLQTRPWIAVFPGIGIVLAVISVNLLGDWFRDALDPNIGAGERGG